MISHILVSISEQRLRGFDHASCSNEAKVMDVPISTAKNGVGQQFGSECTPLGTVFIGRRPTGEIYSPELDKQNPNRDWILTRILWLCGNEIGFNRAGQVDTQRRYVYIHGAPDSHAMGEPSSHGCIKMRNSDIIALFDQVEVGTIVTLVV